MGGEGGDAAEELFDVENTIFVAVGKNMKESKSTLSWALQTFSENKICILHVHQPAQLLTLMDGKFSTNKLKQQAVNSCRDVERQKMHKLLNQYILILAQVGIQAGKVWIEMDNIEKGIVHIIAQHNIKWLVMGAAADKYYSNELLELKSKKALFVCQKAPTSCHIWFCCRRSLIYTRSVNVSSHVRSSVALSPPASPRGQKMLRSCADADEDENADKLERLCSLKLSSQQMDGMRTDCSLLPALQESQDRIHVLSSVILLEDQSQEQTNSEIYHKLEHAMLDAENSKKKVFEESVRRWKAEEDAMEAIHKAEASESLCMKEINQRKEMEDVLARQSQELERMKNQHDLSIKELQMVQDQKLALESQITESRSTEEELEEKIIQAVKLLVDFKEKRDQLKIERDNAIREIKRLRNLAVEVISSPWRSQLFGFSFLEINEATQNFDPSWKIGDGRHGSVYKGHLRHMKVAIKMLPSRGSQGHLEFEHEGS